MHCVQCRLATAHPRSRGENATVWSASSGYMGSSPLTRGKRPARAIQSRCPRLIPAHAGKTGWPELYRGPPAAHPRSRGENRSLRYRGKRWSGSSPLTRGKLSPWPLRWYLVRLIPAHAGKTGYQPHVSTPPSAHPRSRGENSRRGVGGGGAVGSSPLTRGKRQLSIE